MKKIYNILISFLCALSIVSCSKEDDTFAGTDFYITSFTLSKGGIEYEGLISTDQISICAPANIDLSGATAIVKICEHASISPLPSSITDWNDTHKFTITSHSGAKREYTYSVSHSSVKYDGSVILTTQSQVDAFAAHGATIIDGDLIIGEDALEADADTIFNINALSSIKQINGNLTIKNSYAGKDLSGLSSLTKVGNIYIGSSSKAAILTDSVSISLPELQNISELTINDNKVKSLYLPKLESAWNIFINCKSIKKLDMKVLSTIYGNLTVQSGTSTSTANTVIEELTFPALKDVMGNMSINTLTAVNKINLSILTSIGGNFTMNLMSSLEELIIPALNQVDGNIEIKQSYLYSNISAPRLKKAGSFCIEGNSANRPAFVFEMPILEEVTGQFRINYSTATELSLPSLKTLGNLYINQSVELKSVSLPKLTECKTFYFSYISALTEIDLSHISYIEKAEFISGIALTNIKLPSEVKDLTLNGASKEIPIPYLEGVEKIKGTLYITNYKISSINLPLIKEIGTYQHSSVTGLQTLSFPDLEKIGTFSLSDTNINTLYTPHLTVIETLKWNSCYNLTTIDMSSLKEISTLLQLWGASSSYNASKSNITNLDFLLSVERIGAVDIKLCSKLTDFSGLHNALPSLSAETWAVSSCGYNPTYEDMINGKYTK